MSRLVIAGAWTIETNQTYGDVLGSQPVLHRLNYIRDVIKVFDAFCFGASVWKYYEKELYVFVAPEYYFKSQKLNVERCLTKKERNDIIDAFVALSNQYPKTVIIPGTIMWSKSADDKSLEKAEIRLYDAMEAKGWTGQRKEKWEALRVRGQGQVKFVSYHSAYIFYNGYKYKYHKKNDFSENLSGDLDHGTLFIPGAAPGFFPNLGKTDLDFGIEVCGDHDSQALQHPVDIHVLCSAETHHKDLNIRAKPGGLFIHAASGHTEFLINNNGTFETPARYSVPFSAADLVSSDQIDQQRSAFVTEKQKNLAKPFDQRQKEDYGRVFDVKAKHGQLDCWVTEMM